MRKLLISSVLVLLAVLTLAAAMPAGAEIDPIVTAKIKEYPKTCKVGETINIRYTTGGLGSARDNGLVAYLRIFATAEPGDISRSVLLHTETISKESSGILSYKVDAEAGQYLAFDMLMMDLFESACLGGGDKVYVIRVTDGAALPVFGAMNLGKSGWVNKDGKKYYGDKDGVAVTGQQVIDGNPYFFDRTGVLQTGWYLGNDNIWHYSDEQGVSRSGNMYGMKSLTIPSCVDALNISELFGISKDFYIKCEPGSYAEKLAYRYCLQYDNGRKKVIGSSITSVDEKVKWIVANYINPGMTEKEKINRLWTWLHTNSCYDDTYTYYHPDGVLIVGRGTCESSAEAYDLLLKEVGIESRVISGRTTYKEKNVGHCWTLVRYNGQWYHTNPVDDIPTRPGAVIESSTDLLGCDMGSDETFRMFYSWDPEIEADKNKVGWVKTKDAEYYYDGRAENGGRVTGPYTIDNIEYIFGDDGRKLGVTVPVQSVILNKNILKLAPNDSETLEATVRPVNATNQNVSWRSEDPDIAEVDENGQVTALKQGDTKVYVTTEYGDYSACCEIHVAEASPLKAFVKRCYKLILNREPDEGGLNGWSDALKSKTAAAANIIDGFVKSDEFTNRKLSDGAKVDILYETMLDRKADKSGKAGWVDALGKGYTLQHIINGFCASDEFTALCKDYGIEPGTVSVNPVNPEPAPDTPRGKIEAFVKRCYKLILNRDADEGGLQGWSDALETGAGQACQIIDGFVRSPEYVNRNLGYAESVDILYQTMLNRAADSAGRAGWVDALEKGYTLQHIINGFCGSAEFTNICNEFGITAGNLLVQGVIVKREAIAPEGEEEAPVVYVNYSSEYMNEEKIRAFVEHCYEAVFGRMGDAEGVEAYTKLILDGKKTPKRVAYEFIFSDEFQSKLPGNEAFIRILYRLYLNRELGAEELTGWIAMLENGTSLEEIVNSFAASEEFRTILQRMK